MIPLPPETFRAGVEIVDYEGQAAPNSDSGRPTGAISIGTQSRRRAHLVPETPESDPEPDVFVEAEPPERRTNSRAKVTEQAQIQRSGCRPSNSYGGCRRTLRRAQFPS
jgi:hypothetical protein